MFLVTRGLKNFQVFILYAVLYQFTLQFHNFYSIFEIYSLFRVTKKAEKLTFVCQRT